MKLSRHRNERGATNAEVVIAFSIVIALILLIVQFALAAHANSVAEAAAQEGAAVARTHDGTGAGAHARTNRYLDELGPTIIRNRNVDVERTGTQASVTVTGKVTSVIPFLPALTVEKSASGPIERYAPPTASGTSGAP